ncbi:MAG: hypothetical protein AB1861_29310 [Cyanobacteriota bacterium]
MTNEQAERLIAAVERLATAAEALVSGQQRKTSTPAKFIKPIEEFPNFDWGSIGAKVEFRDSDRIVAGVSWRGATYERKSKHGDVWFSRNVGKDDEDNPIYETLIKFAANVVPNSLPTSMVRAFTEQPATTSTTGSTVSAPAPQPQPQPTQPYSLYPEHNNIIKAIRLKTGHTHAQIVDWCQSRSASSPAELSPELCQELAQALALAWGKKRFATPELCENAYRGKVQTLKAGGMHWGNAIINWIESVQGAPVGSR